MDHWFGFRGLWYASRCTNLTEKDSKAYLGIGDNKVEPGKREERKSVGCERWVNIDSEANFVQHFSRQDPGRRHTRDAGRHCQ